MEKLENRLQKEGLKIRKDLHRLDISRTKIDKKHSSYKVKSIFKADKSIEREEGNVFSKKIPTKLFNFFRVRYGRELFQKRSKPRFSEGTRHRA